MPDRSKEPCNRLPQIPRWGYSWQNASNALPISRGCSHEAPHIHAHSLPVAGAHWLGRLSGVRADTGATMKYREPNRHSRVIKLTAFLVFCIMWLVAAQGCTTPPSHNANGGYIDACGSLPPQLGDDC